MVHVEIRNALAPEIAKENSQRVIVRHPID